MWSLLQKSPTNLKYEVDFAKSDLKYEVHVCRCSCFRDQVQFPKYKVSFAKEP